MGFASFQITVTHQNPRIIRSCVLVKICRNRKIKHANRFIYVHSLARLLVYLLVHSACGSYRYDTLLTDIYLYRLLFLLSLRLLLLSLFCLSHSHVQFNKCDCGRRLSTLERRKYKQNFVIRNLEYQ